MSQYFGKDNKNTIYLKYVSCDIYVILTKSTDFPNPMGKYQIYSHKYNSRNAPKQ